MAQLQVTEARWLEDSLCSQEGREHWALQPARFCPLDSSGTCGSILFLSASVGGHPGWQTSQDAVDGPLGWWLLQLPCMRTSLSRLFVIKSIP